jgi:hypothetical protein
MLDVDAVFQADKAIEKMEEILADYPHAANLAREVGTFFGPNFYLKGTSEAYSGFFISCAQVWKPETEPVEIRLVCSRRSQAALVHELLHGNLLMKGYPWSWSYEQQIGHAGLPNLLYHELMVSQYRAFGLPQADFTSPHEILVTVPEDDNKLLKCEAWLRIWLDGRHRENNASIKAAECIKAENSTSGIQFSEIEAWFDGIHQVAPQEFEASYDKLASMIGLPVPLGWDQWFRLEHGSPYPKVIPNTEPLVLRFSK